MLVDELYYHRRRGLGLYESWGHPVDTVVFLIALLLPAFFSPVPQNLVIYAVLGVVSILVITKDEWVHARECEPTEHWLHAMLFVLHGPVLLGLGFIWVKDPGAPILRLIPPIVGIWAFYQFAYWMVYHARIRQKNNTNGEQRLL